MNNEKEQIKFSRFNDFLRKFKKQKQLSRRSW